MKYVALFFTAWLLMAGCGRTTDHTFVVQTSLSSVAARSVRGCDREPCSGGPESLSIKLYKAYVSASADCSSPILVTDHGAAGTTINVGVDALISASPAAGTYPCLILVMSDNLSFVPDADAVAAFPGVCQANTTATFDIFRTGETWQDLDGGDVVATGTESTPGDDQVVIFATTDVSAVTGSSIAPHVNQTVDLTSALTVPGQTTFYVDFDDGIAGSSDCKIEGGTGMGFR